jgi:hypothetical protein
LAKGIWFCFQLFADKEGQTMKPSGCTVFIGLLLVSVGHLLLPFSVFSQFSEDSNIRVGFEDSNQTLGSAHSYDVALGDLDGDKDLDAFVANSTSFSLPNTVWINNGKGGFADSGQSLGAESSHCVKLGDVDGDMDLDAFVPNWAGPIHVWINNGAGLFDAYIDIASGSSSLDVAMADLNGDHHLDAFIADGDEDATPDPNEVWLHNRAGGFSNTGQALGNSISYGIALGDLDGDGDQDAFVANRGVYSGYGVPNKVWLNNGAGEFFDSGQSFDWMKSYDVALGDLDGDGDLDAFVANAGGITSDYNYNQVWFNDGAGTFTDSGQELGEWLSYGVALADLNQDGDLDAFVANVAIPGKIYGYNTVWLNDGTGYFVDSDLRLGENASYAVALGDLNRDGVCDAFVANSGSPNRVYFGVLAWTHDYDLDHDVDGLDLARIAAEAEAPATELSEFVAHFAREFDRFLATLDICPTAPYTDYEAGQPMEWPESGFTNQFNVMATFSDGSSLPDFNDYVTWSSDNEAAATITPDGIFTSGSVSTDTPVTITATVGNVGATLTVNVLNGDLADATIISDNNGDLIHDGDYTVAVGEKEQWLCLCNYEGGDHSFNLTRDAVWESDSPDVVYVSAGAAAGRVSRFVFGAAVMSCSIERSTFTLNANVVVN